MFLLSDTRLTPARPPTTIKTKPFRRKRKLPDHDYSRIIGRCRYGKCGECAPVIDSFGVHRFSSPYLFRRSFPGGAGGFRLGGFSHAAPPAAFASFSSKAGVKTPAAIRASPAPSNTGGSWRPAAGSHRKTASIPGLIWSAWLTERQTQAGWLSESGPTAGVKKHAIIRQNPGWPLDPPSTKWEIATDSHVGNRRSKSNCCRAGRGIFTPCRIMAVCWLGS
jgi:hypothetical protein